MTYESPYFGWIVPLEWQEPDDGPDSDADSIETFYELDDDIGLDAEF